MFEDFAGRNVLLLQGPVGPFFRWLAHCLQEENVNVAKVNFNAADAWFFRGAPTLPFRGKPEQWANFLRAVVKERKIDALFLFGDSRPYHVAACQVAQQLGVDVHVFEEGYLRPNYVTFEAHGTNYQSHISKNPQFFREQNIPHTAEASAVGHTFFHMAWYAIVYAVILGTFGWRYPQYHHHRDWKLLRQAAIWWLSAGRKLARYLCEMSLLREITERRGHYFFVPLQVHDDYQVRNSRFDSVESFIGEIFSSFAQFAPPDAFLVFKHHPRDRGFRDYTHLLKTLSWQHDLQDRIYYVHGLHLPTLLKQARGSVVINSTVGLSSLMHNTPVKCLDASVYDAGASPQNLAAFWNEPTAVDTEVVRRLTTWLKKNVLLNGSFYRSRHWRPRNLGSSNLGSSNLGSSKLARPKAPALTKSDASSQSV